MDDNEYRTLDESMPVSPQQETKSSQKKKKTKLYRLSFKILGGCWNSLYINNSKFDSDVFIDVQALNQKDQMHFSSPIPDTKPDDDADDEAFAELPLEDTFDDWQAENQQYLSLHTQKRYKTFLATTKQVYGYVVDTISFNFDEDRLDDETVTDIEVAIHSNESPNLKLKISKELILSMLPQLEKKNAVTDVWKKVELEWDGPKPENLKFPQHIINRHKEIPLLLQKYVNLETPGWLDIRVSLTKGDEDPVKLHIVQSSLDTIEYVGLAFQNMLLSGKDKRSDAALVFHFLDVHVFVEAFRIWLSIGWNDTFHFSIDVLVLLKDKLIQEKPGRWEDVETECQEVIDKLFENIPAIKEQTDPFYSEIAQVIESKLNTILNYELKSVTKHDVVHTIISDTFWNLKTVTLLPIPSAISRRQYLTVRSFFFLLYVLLLVVHAYQISQTNDFLFREKIGETVDTEGFEGIASLDDFWDWVNNKFLPGMYETEPHQMMLIDDVLLRQTRVEAETCSHRVVTNLPFVCYSKTDSVKSPYSVWKNTSISDLGKDFFGSAFSQVQYTNKDTFTVRLTTNKTIATEIIQHLMDNEWLDWGTQMVALEFMVYSPSSGLLAPSLFVVESSSVGYVKGSHDLMVISENYLLVQYSWSASLLLLFLTGFIFEEMVDFGMSVWGGTTTQIDKKESEFFKQAAPCYLYLSSIWNVIDVLMILTGFIYLITQHDTTVQNYTLHEIWKAIRHKQMAEIFGSLCLLLSFVRILDFLTGSKNIGILIITILKMLIDIARFLLIFIIVVLGFTSAFHLSYSGSSVSDFEYLVKGTIYVFTMTPAGYSIPDTALILDEPGVIFANFLQVFYVFVGIILLLNLLIALMSDTYQSMNEQAVTEYRWYISSPLIGYNRLFALWPSPFSILHFAAFIGMFVYMYLKDFNVDEFDLFVEQVPDKQTLLERKLYAKIVWNYFKENVEDMEHLCLKDERITSNLHPQSEEDHELTKEIN